MAFVLLAAGCSVVGTFGTLGDAGFSVSAVSSRSAGGSTTLEVVAASPPGTPREVAVERAQRVLWQTQRSRIDQLVLVLDGVETTATRDELAARFGPRDPTLDESDADRILLISIFAVVGLVVVAALAVAVGVTVRRRRRLRAGGAGLDPLFAVTGLGAAGGPLVFFLAGFGLLGLSAGWGWFLYAYWPARHHDQTAGMRAVGLRVVTLDGSPVGLGRHIVRWLLFAVETNLGGLIVLLAVTCSARHQRLGDVAAGTVVVRHDLRPVSARQPSPHQASRW